MPTAFCQTAAIKNSGLEVATWAGDKTGGSKPLSRLLCQKTQTSSSKDQTEGFAFLPQISWSGGPKVTVFKLRWGIGRRCNTGLDLIFGCGYLVEFYWQRNYNPWSSPNCPGSKQGYKKLYIPTLDMAMKVNGQGGPPREWDCDGSGYPKDLLACQKHRHYSCSGSG